MNANDVLIDLLHDNIRRLQRFMTTMSDDCLHWTPDPEANSIVVTVWHMGRLFDVFLTRQIQGHDVAQEVWFRNGWDKRTGYDPRGIGRDGWGSVNGYTKEEVSAIPRFSREILLGYVDDVADNVTTYLRQNQIETLLQPGIGFDGNYTRYQLIQMALLDNVRHLGEILALKAMWARRLSDESC